MTNRWWEFYFIRYFVGSVVGAIVILALAFHPDSQLADVIAKLFDFKSRDLLELKAEYFWVILSFGIAFCYISSAPILVLHTLRTYIKYEQKLFDKKSFAKNLVLIIFISVLVISLLTLSQLDLHLSQLLFFYVFICVVFLQLCLHYKVLSKDCEDLFQFYMELVKSRAQGSAQRREYIESYKHLREHGNAFLILVFELILGATLFSCSSLSGALLIIFLWLIPTFPIWFFGTYLESRLNCIQSKD